MGRFFRWEIPITFVGGPFDGESGAATEHDIIELAQLPPVNITSRITSGAPSPCQDKMATRHTYRRNLSKPWIFEYVD